MQAERLRFTAAPDEIVQIWAKHDESERTLAYGPVQIDHIPLTTIDTLHAATAASLGLSCRPRTYEEMLAGHTREGLALLDDLITPEQLVVTIYNKPGDEGACYTLRDSEGEEREIGDAQDDYMVLADVIDRAFGDPNAAPAQPRGVVLTPEQRDYLANLVDPRVDNGNPDDLDLGYLVTLLRA